MTSRSRIFKICLTRQPREGELRNLDADLAVPVEDVDRVNVVADDHVGRGGNEVVSERLGHKGEGAGDSEVAFNYLELVVLGDQLHVERAGHKQLHRDLKKSRKS